MSQEQDTHQASSGASFNQKLSFWAYRFLQLVLRCCSIKLVALFGKGIGLIVWAAMPGRRRIVARNLRIVIDPMLKPAQLRPMVRRNIVLTCMNFACALKTGLMTEKELKQSVRLIGKDPFEENGTQGRTSIACIPHAGNWEILARIRPLFTKVEHFGSMYRKLQNPLLEDLIYQSRTGYGCEMFSKEDGLRSVLRLARTGGLLGVLSDQYTGEGVFVPYYGKVTGTTPLPSILKKICKNKGQLFCVSTRNTSLGRWDAILGTKINPEPNNINQTAADTIAINHALEANQSESKLDGFWMHHRWKPIYHIAPPQEEGVAEVSKPHTKLPCRFIIALPEAFEEAIICIPILRALKNSRFDAELSVICSEAQEAYWSTHTELITHVISTSKTDCLEKHFEQEHIYKDGPFDYLFMFSTNKKLWKNLQFLRPIYTSGFAENPLSTRFNMRVTEYHSSQPRHRVEDYLALLAAHLLDARQAENFAPLQGNQEVKTHYIAPFSSLGEADNWPEEKWAQLVSMLKADGADVKLLALVQDEKQAQTLAAEWGISPCIIKPEEAGLHLGSNSQLIGVDGLLPQLAALYGASCTVMMASRLGDRYRPLGKQHRVIYKHTPCHPCYRRQCDSKSPCIHQLKVTEILDSKQNGAKES